MTFLVQTDHSGGEVLLAERRGLARARGEEKIMGMMMEEEGMIFKARAIMTFIFTQTMD